jgi:hypothetical protein
MMLGGAGDGPGFDASTATRELRATFITNIKAVLDREHYDGVDVDWEENLSTSTQQAQVISFLEELRIAAPGITISWPGFWANMNSKTVTPFHVQVAQRVDLYSIMSYAMLGNWGGWRSWHFSALDGAAPSYPTSIKVSVDEYVAAGVPKNKLLIGIGLYGTYFTRDCVVTAPRQPIAQVPGCVVQSDDNENMYRKLVLDGAFRPAAAGVKTWDDIAKQDYITFSPPWARYGTANPTKITYLTYEDERSIQAKGDYVKAQGLAGTIVWTLNYGFEGMLNPMMDAVKTAFLGGPSPTPTPSTSATPSSPPPPTPTPTPSSSATPPPVDDIPKTSGFGAISTIGGRTDLPGKPHQEVMVTNLNDTGAGSLRSCATATRDRGRVCRFAPGVTGTLIIKKATGAIQIRQPYLTIDGYSAGAPGITIAKDDPCSEGIKVGATHDFEMYGLRFDGNGWGWAKGDPNVPTEDCPGAMNNIPGFVVDGNMAPGPGNPPPWDPKPNPDPRGVWRINVSYNSFCCGMDSNFDPYGHIEEATFEGNFMHDNWHPDSMTAKVAQLAPRHYHISWYANLHARNGERQPQITHNVQYLDMRNNVVYGWWQPGGGGYGHRWKGMSGMIPSTNHNIVANAYLLNKPWVVGGRTIYAASDPDKGCLWGDVPKDGNDGPHTRIKATALYYFGNLFPPGRLYGGWNCVSTATGQNPWPVPPAAVLPSISWEDVLAKAGMPYPTQEEIDLKAEVGLALAERQQQH